MKVAALDLGTNTFLCLIAEIDAQRVLRVEKDLMQIVRLGQDLQKTGFFHPEALVRARQCLESFKKEIVASQVEHILAMATSAARDAKNGEELFKIGKELGIPIEIIDGSEEAQISYQGATFGVTDLERPLVIDVGGGSTEYISGDHHQILFGKSLDIGAVRLTEKFISAQPISQGEQQNLQEHIKKELLSLRDLQNIKKDGVIAVAGTPTTLASLEWGEYSESKIHGFYLTLEKLEEWARLFAQTSVEEKKQKWPLLGGRADIIFAGTCILIESLKSLGFSGLTVSTKGVRYGVALAMYDRLS